jgi:acetate kinase
MNVLVVNCGSSSLKLSLLGPDDTTLARNDVDRWGTGDTGPIGDFLEKIDRVDAVAHRIVHGADRYTSATVIDASVIAGITDLTDLAPLHQPRALAAIRATRTLLHGTIEVACFDTAFHCTLPRPAYTYAIPGSWRSHWPVRRFGFHGLSHAFAARRAAEITGIPLAGARIVTCHLGSGASLCAVRRGCSIDTTMGFTPLEGLVMGTRAGSVDPGLVLWLIQYGGLTASEVGDALEHRSGLAGLSGGSGDMREVTAAMASGDDRSVLAFEVYTHRLTQSIGAMAASLGGLDVLVFTGGIGERAPVVRRAAVDPLGFLGVFVDESLNFSATADAEITSSNSPVKTVVVTSREDVEMARQTRALLGT